MRQEVLIALENRIQDLKKIAKPKDVETGMSGSFIWFNFSIQSHEVMTKEEFDDCIYDDWLRQRHNEVFKEINKASW
jgi:hypothetical protein